MYMNKKIKFKDILNTKLKSNISIMVFYIPVLVILPMF